MNAAEAQSGVAEPPGQVRASPFLGPLVVACVAWLATIATLAPESGGPGMACDEPYHVAYGKRLVLALRQQGLAFFRPDNVRRNFDWRRDGPPAHPPLGNWLLGWTHHILDPAPNDPATVSIVAARFAPAFAFGVLVFVIGWWTARMFGPVAGTTASAACLLTPRLFGHAHLAALDMFTALFFTAAAIAVLWADLRGRRLVDYGAAGAIWGLALLTRFHGLLLLPPVALWLLARWRWRGLGFLAAWLVAGAAIFLAGWPWLWLDPIGHFGQFLGTATHRASIHVFYWGRAWADTEVPRHYALATFLATVPAGLLVLGLAGLWANRRRSTSQAGLWFLIGTLVFVLLVFSLPRVPVYDGERLFLMTYPLWAVAAGAGVQWVIEHPVWGGATRRFRIGLVWAFVALQAVSLVLYHPCYLSHYSLLVGGLPGAERLGFEVNYWGDTVTESLLRKLAEKAPGATVLFAPNLAPFQAPMVGVFSPALASNQIRVIGWDGIPAYRTAGCRYGIFYRRRADLDGIPAELLDAQVVAQQKILGVLTAQAVEFPDPIGQGRLKHLMSRPESIR